MTNQMWQAPLISQADGGALTNSTALTSILVGAGKYTMRAGEFLPGTWWRIAANGRISTLAATPGTLTFDVTIGGIVVFNSGAISLNTTAQTNATWRLTLDLQVRSIGSGTLATIIGIGEFRSAAVVGSPAGAANAAVLPATAPAVGGGFDSMSAALVDLRAAWSVASASNSITAHQFLLSGLYL